MTSEIRDLARRTPRARLFGHGWVSWVGDEAAAATYRAAKSYPRFTTIPER
jgi:hypothetical protein